MRLFTTSGPSQDPTAIAPHGRSLSLLPDGSIFAQGGTFEENGGGIIAQRWSLGAPRPRTRFEFQDAPVLDMGAEIDFDATFPSAALSDSGREGSSGSTANSSTALAIPVWFPSDGPPSMGVLTRVGSSHVLRVPHTPFPGLGLMFLASNGKLTGIGPAFIAPSGSNGTQCKDAGECASGHCVDGVCCNEVCDASCEACSKAANGAGEDGTCGAVAKGSVDDACEQQEVSSCGLDGKCDGQGSCALYADGTACGLGDVCSGGECTKASGTCDENGAAVDVDGTIHDCLGYRCQAGGCIAVCRSNRDCAGGFACTADGRCEPPLSNSKTINCGCQLPFRGNIGAASGMACLLALGVSLRRRRSRAERRARR